MNLKSRQKDIYLRKHCCRFVSIFTFIFLFRVHMFFKNCILLFYRYANNGKAPLILNIILSLLQFYETFSTRLFSKTHEYMLYSGLAKWTVTVYDVIFGELKFVDKVSLNYPNYIENQM